MPFYYTIDNTKKSGRRTGAKLLELRHHLDQQIPQRTHNDTLLLATWNIREFDSSKYGNRFDESLFYLAEIVSRFDLVAIQEVREDLQALENLTRILGGWWRYLFTDVTEGSRGNRERMAFLYDSRKVRSGGLAGEIVLPAKKKKGKPYQPVLQFARSPYIAGFKSGWFQFMLATVHILYGKAVAEDPRRVHEIQELAKFLRKRANEKTAWRNNLILVGDFNIFNIKDATFEALTDNGFVIPEQIQKLPSNAPRNKHYDQIAFILQRKMNLKQIKAGVFNFFDTVYREEDEKEYIPEMGDAYYKTGKGKKRDEKKRRAYYKAWRTFQMSDHLPMWVELKIDFGEEYLKAKSKKP